MPKRSLNSIARLNLFALSHRDSYGLVMSVIGQRVVADKFRNDYDNLFNHVAKETLSHFSDQDGKK